METEVIAPQFMAALKRTKAEELAFLDVLNRILAVMREIKSEGGEAIEESKYQSLALSSYLRIERLNNFIAECGGANA
jgi:hypothetical protein